MAEQSDRENIGIFCVCQTINRSIDDTISVNTRKVHMPNLSGQSIGRYHIIEPLGEGGMATVYKAYDTRLEREVAIKFIRTGQIPADHLEKIQKRFEREAKRMAKFTHPNIVQVIDYGDYEGTPYLVMPYLAGGTLKDRLKARAGKPMPYQEAARLLVPVSLALQYAHEQETIHRDVKPANILLTNQGQPLLSDFGVAKILDLEDGQTLTGTGVGVGTPEYMAPEQWMNKVVPQTDVYSLGVVFYEMVTGRKPYVADTPAAILVKQSTEPLLRPRDLNPELPFEVEQVLYKALAKDPLQRYVTMEQFAATLERLAGIRPEQENEKPTTEVPAETVVFTPPSAFEEKHKQEQPLPYENASQANVQKQTEKQRIPGWVMGLAGGMGILCIGLIVVAVLLINMLNGKTTSIPPTQIPIVISQPTQTTQSEAPKVVVPKASGKIKIASQSPLSGGMSAVGIDIKNGAQLAIDQLAKPLMDEGFTIELTAYDDQGNPDAGVANAKQIVSDPEVLCVVGHYNSGVQIPSSEEYHNAGLANVSPANTNPKVTDRGYLEVNRIVGRDDVQGQVAAQFAISIGMKRAYLFHDKTAYGQGVAEFFKAEMERKGIKVLGFEGTDEKANFAAILNPAIAANPEVIYFGGMYDQSNVLFKQAREKGFKGMFLSDDGYDSPESVKIAGKALLSDDGTFYTTVSGPVELYPDAAQFAQDFKAKFNAAPQPFAAQAYDAAGICLKAIADAAQAAGGKVPPRAEVAKAVRAIQDYKGISGTINFNKNGDLSGAKYYVIQVVSDDPAKWSANPVVKTFDIAPPEK